MGLMKNLVDVYDNLYASSNENLPMIISHSEQNAHIEILLDEDGKLLSANKLDKDSARTLIPVTVESSSARTSTPRPHPLFDKLQYISKDLINHVNISELDDRRTNALTESTRLYFEQLDEWISYVEKAVDNEMGFSAEEALKRLLPYRNYLTKNDIIADLLEQDIIEENEKGFVEYEQRNNFIRFRVHIGIGDDRINHNSDVQNSYISYYKTKLVDQDLCMITGEKQKITTNHPKFIRHPADSAKLISVNDTINYTFRGRFVDAREALSIGYESSEKAHNALKWLIKNQSTRQGETIFLSFSTKNQDIPEPMGLLFQDDDEKGEEDLTDQIYSEKVNRAIKGYCEQLEPNSVIVSLILDSATPGRLSVVFYRELQGSRFLQNLNQWSEKTSWELMKYNDKSKQTYYKKSNPLPIEIAKACYGNRISDKLLKSTLERIYKCIVDGDVVPRDLVETIKQKASNYEGIGGYEWEKTLRVACAMFRNYYELKEGECYSMSLDRYNKDRSYLYGRLLAVADWIEQGVLIKEEQSRATNALRYMNAYSNRPFKTWTTIKNAILPYEIRQNEYRDQYDREFEEIMSNFTIQDFENDKPLTGKYLLGYYHQRDYFRKQLEERKVAKDTKNAKENIKSDLEENQEN